MSTRGSNVVRGIRMILAATLVLVAAVFAGSARAADPPLVAVNLGGSQPTTGSVAQSGQTDACLNGQHSAVSPNTGNPLQINTGACATNSTQTGGTGTAQGSGGSQSSAGSQSSGNTTATGSSASSTSGSKSTASKTGLRIARVQYSTNGTGLTKRFRVLVTVRDLNGRRVSNAIVSIGALAGARHTVGGTNSTFSNRLGQAGLFLTATKPMLGQRVLLRIAARTPGARAGLVGSVLLPRDRLDSAGLIGPTATAACLAIPTIGSAHRSLGLMHPDPHHTCRTACKKADDEQALRCSSLRCSSGC